jgi:hypothetical protein
VHDERTHRTPLAERTRMPGRTADEDTARRRPSGGSVGKRTLAELAYRPAVQQHGGAGPGARDEAAVHAAAERGVATPATSLPHGDRIQRLFGRHDISSVRAHASGEASAATRAMGAEAYATGNDVVLGGSAELFTVAHEAAHVVQQRGGAQLKSGLGEAGDPHEQHADEVAALVVQGQSAERALDRYVGGAATGDAVQRSRVVQRMRLVAQRDGYQEVEFGATELRPDGNGLYKNDGYVYEEVSRTQTSFLYERRLDPGRGGPAVNSDDESSDGEHDHSHDESSGSEHDHSHDDSGHSEADGEDREPNTLDHVPSGPLLDDEELEPYIAAALDKIRVLLRKRTNSASDVYGHVYRDTLEQILRHTVETWFGNELSEDDRHTAMTNATTCLGVSVPDNAGIHPRNHEALRYDLRLAAYDTATAAGGVRVPANDLDELIDDREYGNPEDTDPDGYEALAQALNDYPDGERVDALTNRIAVLQTQSSRESMRELRFYTNAYAAALGNSPPAHAITVVARHVNGQIGSRRAQAIGYQPDEELQGILDEDLPPLPEIGAAIEDVEQDFDVLARKSARPPKGAIFETDMAQLPTQKGIPIDRARVDVDDQMPTATVNDAPPTEKVMAIGFQGAIDFEGELSAGKPTPIRVYGALFPKGLISKWGVDMKDQNSPNLKTFKQHSNGGDKNKLFSIRYEKSTAKTGQVHLHDDWLVEESAGIFHSQLEIMRQRVIGVVEVEQAKGGWIVTNVKDFTGSYGDLF